MGQVTLRSMLLPESAMRNCEGERGTTALGPLNTVLFPHPSLHPVAPLPTRVVTMPVRETLRIHTPPAAWGTRRASPVNEIAMDLGVLSMALLRKPSACPATPGRPASVVVRAVAMLMARMA